MCKLLVCLNQALRRLDSAARASQGRVGALVIAAVPAGSAKVPPYPDELCQGVVDVRSSGQEETTAGAQLVEEEQLLVLGKERKPLSTKRSHSV